MRLACATQIHDSRRCFSHSGFPPSHSLVGTLYVDAAMPNAAGVYVRLALAGCTPLKPPTAAKSPLLPVRMSPESVALDLFFVRCPFNDAKLNRTLWANVDEQPFPAELRLAWMRNGFRVGIVADEIPAEIAELLELNNPATPSPARALEKQVDLLSQSRVTNRHLQIRSGGYSEIVTSGVYDELPLLRLRTGPDRRANVQQGPDAVHDSHFQPARRPRGPGADAGNPLRREPPALGSRAGDVPAGAGPDRTAASIRWPSPPRSRRDRCW